MFSAERCGSSAARVMPRSSELAPLIPKDVTKSQKQTTAFRNRNSASIRPNTRWPRIYLFIMKALCLLHGRQVVSSRQCHWCRLQRLNREREVGGHRGPLPNYLYPSAIETPAGWWDGSSPRVLLLDGDVTDTRQDTECDVCRSMWWDADGQCVEYNEQVVHVGIGRWNHRLSKQLSIFLPLILISFTLYEGVTYFIAYWGDEMQLLGLISYSSFLCNIGMVPSFLIVANLRHIVQRHRVNHFAWTTALHPRYIIKRLQYLRPAKGVNNAPFLIVCLLLPLMNHGYRISIFFLKVYGKTDDGIKSYQIQYITLFSDACARLLWGCFCYLISILRASIKTQFNLDIAFLREHIGKVDLCRRRLAASLDEYGSLSNLCANWIILTIVTNTLGTVIHVSYNYSLFSGEVEISELDVHIALCIWCEIMLVFTLPLLAVGGFNLHHIWSNFLGRILEIRSDEYDKFWTKMCTFVTDEFNPVTDVGTLTLAFTVISFCMALNVVTEQAAYWDTPTAAPTTGF